MTPPSRDTGMAPGLSWRAARLIEERGSVNWSPEKADELQNRYWRDEEGIRRNIFTMLTIVGLSIVGHVLHHIGITRRVRAGLLFFGRSKLWNWVMREKLWVHIKNLPLFKGKIDHTVGAINSCRKNTLSHTPRLLDEINHSAWVAYGAIWQRQ